VRVLPRMWSEVVNQQGHLFGWTPVLLGIGIAAYFASPTEPDARLCLAMMVVGAALGVGDCLVDRWFRAGGRACP